MQAVIVHCREPRRLEAFWAEGLGATRADVGQGEEVSWQVMADPVGNEFCILAPYPPDVRELWQAQYDAYQRP